MAAIASICPGRILAAADPRGAAHDLRLPGALADGHSHPIGRRFGSSPQEAATRTMAPDGGPLSWMTDERFGLVFHLTVSRTQATPDRTATFLKDVPTIFGTETFAQFNGDPGEGQKQLAPGWLVAGPGLQPGTTVARLDAAAGTITFSKDPATALRDGTRLAFSLPPEAFQSLETDYVAVQSAVVAASARGGGVVALPPGDYRWNHTVWNPGAIDGPSLRGNVSVVGADEVGSRIEFTTDLGPGGCAVGDRNRGVGSVGTARYARFRILGPGRPHNDGRAVAGMDGLCVGQAARVEDVSVQRFHAGVNVVKDHGILNRVDASNNFYGFYFAANGDSIGNWKLADSNANANSWAGLAVAWNNQIDFSLFRNLDLGGGSPYAMYREKTPPGRAQVAGFISHSLFEHIFTEQAGLGWVYAENPSDQVDRNTFIDCTVWLHPSQYKVPGRRLRAVVFAGHVTGNTFIASDLSNGGAHDGIVQDAITLATDNIQSNDWGDLTDAILKARPGMPYLSAPTVLFNAFKMDRGAGGFLKAEQPIEAGQLLAFGTARLGSSVRPMAAGRTFRGVAAQTVAAGQVLPVLTTGLATVHKEPGAAIPDAEPVMPSQVDPTRVSIADGPACAAIGTWAGASDGAPAATEGLIELGRGPFCAAARP